MSVLNREVIAIITRDPDGVSLKNLSIDNLINVWNEYRVRFIEFRNAISLNYNKLVSLIKIIQLKPRISGEYHIIHARFLICTRDEPRISGEYRAISNPLGSSVVHPNATR